MKSALGWVLDLRAHGLLGTSSGSSREREGITIWGVVIRRGLYAAYGCECFPVLYG